MKRAYHFSVLLLLSSVWLFAATNIEINGTVSKTGGGPLKDVEISLAKASGITAKTDSEGKFFISEVKTIESKTSQSMPLKFGLKGNDLVFYSAPGKMSGNVSVFSGNGRQLVSMDFTDLSSQSQRLTLPSLARGLNILRVTINNQIYTCPVIQIGYNYYLKKPSSTTRENFTLAKALADSIIDTLIAEKDGYSKKIIPIKSYNMPNTIISMDSTVNPVVTCDFKTLKEAGECSNRKILIGTAVSPSRLNNLVSQEFNYVTPENEMKWQNIEGSEGQFSYYQADQIVSWAKSKGIKVKGHCLVWHSQLANWVNQAKGRERVLGIMKKHIETVMGHFGNDVYAWDVVNEAIATDDDIGAGNARMRNTVFYNEIGPDYIEQAFKIAREYADSHGMKDMKLYYNDYSIDADNDKSRYARTVIKGWVDKGVPVDGIGFQMHIGPPNNIPTAESVKDNFQYYADLGLEVLISEWDINLCGNKVTKQQQLQLYHDITKVCVEQPKCVAITFWGINDSESWLNSWSTAMCGGGNSQSLLFNNNQKKETYTQVLNALNGK